MGMTGGFAAMGVLSGVSAYNQATSAKAQATFTAAQYEENQKIAGLQATDAVSRGEFASGVRGEQTRQQEAEAKAAGAASGVDINSGSAVAVQGDIERAGIMDQLTIKNNAWKEAWGYKVQAANYGNEAAMTRIAGQNQYNNTLLTGGINAASFGMKAYGAYKANNGSNFDPNRKPTGLQVSF